MLSIEEIRSMVFTHTGSEIVKAIVLSCDPKKSIRIQVVSKLMEVYPVPLGEIVEITGWDGFEGEKSGSYTEEDIDRVLEPWLQKTRQSLTNTL